MMTPHALATGMPQDFSFIVPGQAQAASAGAALLGGQVTASVRVGARRGAGDSVRLTARPGEDMVVLSIEDVRRWCCTRNRHAT